jgi:hypothetical protein
MYYQSSNLLTSRHVITKEEIRASRWPSPKNAGLMRSDRSPRFVIGVRAPILPSRRFPSRPGKSCHPVESSAIWRQWVRQRSRTACSAFIIVAPYCCDSCSRSLHEYNSCYLPGRASAKKTGPTIGRIRSSGLVFQAVETTTMTTSMGEKAKNRRLY